jgi:hypothetical protein
MSGLCKYKDALGVPNHGFHSSRLFGFARNDVLGTFVIAFIIALIFYPKTLLKSFIIISILLFIIAIFLHRLFCVNTTLNKKIFGKV